MKCFVTQLINSFLLASIFLINTALAGAAVYSYTPVSDKESLNSAKTVIGVEFPYVVQKNETLLQIALHFGIGYEEIIKANPGVDAWVPPVGSTITIPTTWVLPNETDTGIIINKAEMRLYHFLKVKGKKVVRTFPLGIGSQGLETPEGIFRISTIEKNPVWNVPASIRREDPSLPASVPPGPSNPLGSYWLRLSNTNYGIHGTNKPLGVGRRVSHGCIRMYPQDIKTLAKTVKLGTRVKIINQPIKIGFRNGEIFIEVNPYHEERDKIGNLKMRAYFFLKKNNLLQYVDNQLFTKAINDARGYPVRISKEIIKGEDSIFISFSESPQKPQ
jgi:L,D-transpeptidase ErfK/SrfK